MSRRNLVVVCAIVLVLAAALWATVAWVPADGGCGCGQPRRVGCGCRRRGPAIAPRWSGERFGSATGWPQRCRPPLADGAKVETVIELAPPVGVWQLAAATRPGRGCGGALPTPCGRRSAVCPLACLARGLARPGGLSAGPRGLLAASRWRCRSASPRGRSQVDPGARPRGGSRAVCSARSPAGLSLPRHKVLVLGLDGLDWDLVLPWVEAGRMPNLEATDGRRDLGRR